MSFEPGSHVCSIYANQEEQFSAAANFFKHGLVSNEKCIYVTTRCTPRFVISMFKKKGLSIAKQVKSGQFIFISDKNIYLKFGSFEPDKMIALWKETETEALAEGYAGIRVTGDASWAAKSARDCKKLIEYESKFNNVFIGSKTTALCQYAESKFPHQVLAEAIHTHPQVIMNGKQCKNMYFNPALLTPCNSSFKIHSYHLIKEDLLGK